MIIAYILDQCMYSNEAEKLIQGLKINSNIIRVPQDEKIKQQLKKKNKMNTFPQIFIQVSKTQQIPVGGYTELCTYIDTLKKLKHNQINPDVIYMLSKMIKFK
jgi:glutaredoxin